MSLFDDLEDLKGCPEWNEEWQDMPEYVSEDLDKDGFQVIVNFKSLDDMIAFGKFVNQKITYRTKFIWWPTPPATESYKDKFYTDEPTLSSVHSEQGQVEKQADQ